MAKPATKRVSSTVDDIVRHLKHEIDAGVLPPGHRLVQEDLSERLGVSRGPVREAFRRLASEGLIELKFNSGARVRVFTRAEILALEEAREAVEGAAARFAAERFRASGREADLIALMQALESAAQEGAQRTYLTLNEHFHHLILAIAGNPILAGFAAQLHTKAIQSQLSSYDGDWMAESEAEHRRIASAIMAADAPAAEAAMREHLRRVRAITERLSPAFFAEG